MTTITTTGPGLGDSWSSFGAIVLVSVLGPALALLFTVAPVFLVELASVYLDLNLCNLLGFCAPGGIGTWSTWLINDSFLLYVLWVTLGTGFACVVTMESAFHIFRRAAPIPVLGWHAVLMFALSSLVPIDWLSSLISLGWAGTALVSMHYYLSYKSLPLYVPPKAPAEKAKEALPPSHEIAETAVFPASFSTPQKRSISIMALYITAMLGLAYYGFLKDMALVFVIGVGNALYLGLFLLNKLLSSRSAPSLTMDSSGLGYRGQHLSWGEIGRVWRGPQDSEHIVVIETSAEGAKRMLLASNWVNRLFALIEVVKKRAGMVAHSVSIDTRFLSCSAAELAQAIDARKPPASGWIPGTQAN